MGLNTKFFVEISDLPPRLPQGLPEHVSKHLLAPFSPRQTAAVPVGLAADSSWRGHTWASVGLGPRAHDWSVIRLPLLTPATSWGPWRLCCQVWAMSPTPHPARVTGRKGGPPLRSSCGPIASSWEVEPGFLSSALGSREVKGLSSQNHFHI